METVFLSIIVPTYNRQKSLLTFMTLLSRQAVSAGFLSLVEVIIIDDCSEKQVHHKGSPLKVLIKKNNVNLGAPLSRIKGFTLSQGKFIHFHDSDDSITESWLSDLIGELQSNPDLDLLVTGREVHENNIIQIKSAKFFHKNIKNPEKIKNWLAYQNCIGPLGGVTFSRRVLEQIRFLSFSSCQDWQMYIDAIEHAKVLRSRPDIHFVFNKGGEDRISKDARKKILGHLQLSRVTSKMTIFKKHIRLFYLYSCTEHINDHGGNILRFYNNNKLKITMSYWVINIFWRLSLNGIKRKS